MQKIGLSLILILIISGCTATKPTNNRAYTEQPKPSPISVTYETVTPQQPISETDKTVIPQQEPVSTTYETVTQQEEPIIYEEVIIEPEAQVETQITHSEPIAEPQIMPQRENISVKEAFSMIQKGDVTVLDVRTQQETISDKKIANSQLIPLQVLGSYIDQIDNSKPVLVYCRSGNRSAVAANILRDQGFNAINVLGGINAWKANGLSVE